MKINQFNQFTNLCTEQGVDIHARVVDAVYAGNTNKARCYTPDDMNLAVVEAGDILRKNPDTLLASGPVVFSHSVIRDVGARSLAEMINASHQPARVKDYDTYFVCKDAQSLDTCPEADIGFAETFDALEGLPDIISDGIIGFQVIVAGDQPIFVRKAIGEPSAISLQEVIINGIPYPPGSLMRVDLTRDLQQGNYTEPYIVTPAIDSDYVEIIPAATVTKAAFLRLSGFAYPPGKRDAYAQFENHEYYYDSNISQTYTLDMLRDKLRNDVLPQFRPGQAH